GLHRVTRPAHDVLPASRHAGRSHSTRPAARLPRVRRRLPRLTMGTRPRTERPRIERQRMGQVSRIALAVSVVALTFALGRLQILASDQYAIIAKENRVRPIVVPAPRGTIYD